MELDTSKAEAKIASLKSKLNSIKDEKIDVDVNITQAMQSIDKLEASFTSLKAQMETGIKINVDFGEGTKRIMSDMDAITKQAQNNAKIGVEAMNSNLSPNSSFADMMKIMDKMNREMQNSLNKKQNEYGTTKNSYDQLQNAKAIVSTMKELDKINKDVAKSEGIRSKESIDALERRRADVQAQLRTLESDYRVNFGKSPSDDPMIQQTANLLEYQRVLRDVSQEQKEQNDTYKEQTKLENERYKLLTKADKSTTGPNEAAELRSQAAAIEQQIASIENANRAWETMSDTQRVALTSMKAQNDAALQGSRQLQSAQQEDRSRAESQKAMYSELERAVRDYYNTAEKVSQLEAQRDVGSLSGKDSLKLDSLQQELQAREEITAKIKEQIQAEDLSDNTRDSKVAALEKERSIRADSVADIAKINAELKKTDDAYKEIEQSVQRQSQLTKQLESAGDNEAIKIRELIQLEEQRQAQIRETNNLQQNGTKEMDEQITKKKEEIKLNERNAEELRQAKSIDSYNDRMATNSSLTDLINPRQIFNDGKQAFQYLYNNVKQLDDAMTNVRKVADATPQEFATFEREIFDMASSVGKSADLYAVSVERWASAGYDLQEANKMAGYSTMGAFVGNVDEAAMVDYMAVPLIAYKDAGLEAWDVLNAMNEVANNNAIEMDALGAAYSRAASTASNAGTSFSELTGLIGAAEETTRLGGETIGTSIRTMDINIGKIAARDTKGFEDKFDFLESIGVNIMDANGELNSTYDVLQQLQSVWGDLDTVAQTKAATMLAGSRGQAVMTAWMNNWERVQKIQAEAEGQLGFEEGYGSAYDEFAAMQDSMEYKQAQLKNAWSEFIHVATGGKGPFIGILEVVTDLVNKMTELAENDAIRTFATGIAKAFAGLVATSALTQGFAVVTRAIGATFNTIKGAGVAIKGIMSIGKGGGLFKGLVGGMSGLLPTLGLVITGFMALDAIVLGITGRNLTSHIGDWIDTMGFNAETAKKKFKDFREAVEESNEHMANSAKARAAIESQQNLAKAYAESQQARERAFAESGQWQDLTVPTEEFENLKNQHNQLVEQMGLPISLAIEFNNHDHIMSQIKDVELSLLQLESQEIELSISAGSEEYQDITEFSGKAMSAAAKEIELRNQRGNLLNKEVELTKQIAEASVAGDGSLYESLTQDLQGVATSISEVNKELEQLNVTGIERTTDELQRVLSDPKNMEALQSYATNIKQAVDYALDSTDPSYFMDKNFGKLDRGAQTLGYITLIDEITARSRALSGASSDFNTLQESIKGFSGATEDNQAILETAYSEITSFASEYKDLLDTGAMKDVLGDQSLDRFLQGATTAEETIIRMNAVLDAIPKAIGEAGENMGFLTDEAVEFGRQMEISEEATRNLVKVASEEGQAGFFREAFALDKDSSGMNAAFALGVGEAWEIMQYDIQRVALNTSTSIAEAYGSAFEAITIGAGSMGEALSRAWHLTDPTTGAIQYETIAEDLTRFRNKDFNVEFGIKTSQGEIENLENLYRTLELASNIDKEQAIEMGIEYSTDGREMLENLINGETEGKIDIKPVINQEGFVDELQVLNEKGDVVAEIPYSMILEEDEELQKILEREYAINVKVGYEETVGGFDDIGWLGGQENADQGAMAYLRERLFPQLQAEYGDISLNVGVDVTNAEAVEELHGNLKELEGSAEGRQILIDIATNLNMDTEGEITADSILGHIWYLLEDGMQEGELELIIDVLSKLNLIEDPNQDVAEEANEVAKAGVGEGVTEVERDVSLATNIIESEGSVGGLGAIGDIPESVETVWNIIQEGEVTASTIDDLINNMPESVVTKYDIDTGNSTKAIEQINGILEGMDTEQQVDFLVNAMGIEDAVVIQEILAAADGDSAETNISIVSSGLDEGVAASEALDNVDGKIATGGLIIDAEEAKSAITGVESRMDQLSAKEAKPRIGANDSVFRGIMSGVDASLARTRTTTVRILGDASHYRGVLGSLPTRSVTVNIVGKRTSSVAVGQRLGTSFSAAVGSELTGRSSSQAVGRSASTETKVNEDVWRYWAKELFTGLPIEKSLDELSNQIKMAGDNQDELVRLYREQIKAIDRQIAHERDMQKAQQEEMNYILGELKKQGFTASGNQITNLDRAKTFSGDTASEVDKLLSDWKSLYESIESLDTTISKLNLEKFNAEEDIRDAKIEKELQKIEARLKSTEALMRSVENNTSIQSAKEKMVNSADYDLILGVNEQGMNTASQAVRELIAEYNNLSKTSVEYEENAEEIYDTLEDLKSTILDNADAILEYREDMKSVELDRLLDDFSRFSDVMARNGEVISNNVEIMQDGLLSGQLLTDLAGLGTLDIGRKTKLERDQELRLELEAELNNALEAYSNKNIEKTASAANKILQIEANKYGQLLQMAKDYSDGVAISPTEISVIGDTEMTDTANQQQYDLWKNKLERFTVDYSKEYADMVERYQRAIEASESSADKQALRNQMVLEQLKMQEKLYKDIIDYNNQFIALGEKELENANLTTEQRNQLLDAIEEYRTANIDAQNSIRETVASRFDFEFSLLDKATEKAQQYSDSLAHMLEVADLINVSPTGKETIYDAIYQSLVNQYAEAKSQLQSLSDQQSQFEAGSYEWTILAERIAEVREQMRGFGVDALNANRDILNNALESVRDTWEKGLLDDKTLEQWKDYHENWVSGVEKELQLENLRQKSIGLEGDLLKQRLEMLDRQDDVSKKDLDYLDKQMKVIELEQKLANISDQRDVQTLVRRDDGTYAWDYVSDQSQYDKTQKELNDARIELEQFRNEQRQSYADSLGGIIDRAQTGGYQTSGDLMADLDRLRAVYGTVLSDIPDLDTLSLEQIMSAYEKYLATNDLLATDLVGGGGAVLDATISNIGAQFEKSFMNIATDFGKVIGAELKDALGITGEGTSAIGGVTYQIERVELPNVSDANGFASFFNELSRTVDQQVNSK